MLQLRSCCAGRSIELPLALLGLVQHFQQFGLLYVPNWQERMSFACSAFKRSHQYIAKIWSVKLWNCTNNIYQLGISDIQKFWMCRFQVSNINKSKVKLILYWWYSLNIWNISPVYTTYEVWSLRLFSAYKDLSNSQYDL